MMITKKTRILLAVLVALCGSAILGCGAGGGAGGVAALLPRLKPLEANCNGPINAYDGLDVSATGRGDPGLNAERMATMHGLADQVDACGGVLKVVAFSSGTAETAVLGEARFPTSSGTDTARLIKGNDAEGELVDEVEQRLPQALKELHPGGTDILGQWELARQFAEQLPEGHLYVEIETDGINTVKPVVMNTPTFTPAVAQRAAENVTLPNLDGATVRIVGIGKTSGARRPATERVDALTKFYELSCHRSGAATCLVTTDYTAGA